MIIKKKMHIIRRFQVLLSIHKSKLLSRCLKKRFFLLFDHIHFWILQRIRNLKQRRESWFASVSFDDARSSRVTAIINLVFYFINRTRDRSNVSPFFTSCMPRARGPSRECQTSQATCYFVPQLLMNDHSDYILRRVW